MRLIFHISHDALPCAKQAEAEVAAEAEGQRALHGLRKCQTPEAAQTIGLGESAAVAETPEMDRTAFPVLAHLYCRMRSMWPSRLLSQGR